MTTLMGRDRRLFGGNLWQLSAISIAIFISWQGIMGLPILIGTYIDGYGFSPNRGGLLGTAEVFTLSIVAILLAARIAVWSKARVALIGLFLIVTGQAFSALVDSFYPVLLTRILVGFGAGLVYGAACASIAGLAGGERLYAWGTSMSQILTAVMLAGLPIAAITFGSWGVFAALAVLGLVFGPFLLRLPDFKPGDIVDEQQVGKVASPVLLTLLFMGISLFNLAIGMIWAFTERRAEELGLGAGEVGVLLAMLPLGGIGGSMLAGIVGARFGRLPPLILGMSACMAACFLIALGPPKPLLFAAIFALGAFELFCFPFLISTAAALDVTGKLATLAGGISILAYSLGPGLGGFISSDSSAVAVCIAAGVLCVVAALALLPIGRILDREE